MWTFVFLGFGLLACAWAAMFFYAGRARVESVPLAPSVTHSPPASVARTESEAR